MAHYPERKHANCIIKTIHNFVTRLINRTFMAHFWSAKVAIP